MSDERSGVWEIRYDKISRGDQVREISWGADEDLNQWVVRLLIHESKLSTLVMYMYGVCTCT